MSTQSVRKICGQKNEIISQPANCNHRLSKYFKQKFQILYLFMLLQTDIDIMLNGLILKWEALQSETSKYQSSEASGERLY